MKRNLLLTGTLTLLLVLVYFSYELPKHESNPKKDAILDFSSLGELKAFKNNKIEIRFVGEKAYIGNPENNHIASRSNVDLFLNYLGNLHHKKILTGERKDYIPDDSNQFKFEFEYENIIFTLGEKLKFSPEYYLEIARKNQRMIVLVEDRNIPDGIYQEKDAHNHDLNYRQILTLMNLDETFFESKDIFRLNDQFIISKIDLTNFRGSSYQVEFQNKKTNPEIPPLLKFDDANTIAYLDDLKKLSAKKLIISPDINSLDQKLGEITIQTANSGEFKLSLYNLYKKKPGYFLQNSRDNVVFQLERKNCEFFFYPIDFFWNMKYLETLPENYNKQNEKIFSLISARALKIWKGNPNDQQYKYLDQLISGEVHFKFYTKASEVLITVDDKTGLLYHKENE